MPSAFITGSGLAYQSGERGPVASIDPHARAVYIDAALPVDLTTPDEAHHARARTMAADGGLS
jgi:hypothetical protein